MAKNVLPKHWNGSEFEELHIVTKASNVFTNDNKSVQQKIDDFTSHKAESASKHITESGTNVNGSYIKFDDGTVIAFAIANLGSVSSFAKGFHNIANLVVPVNMVSSISSISTRISSSDTIVGTAVKYHNGRWDDFWIEKVNDSTAVNSVFVYLMQIGRWK